MNVYRYDPKAGLKHAYRVDVFVADDESETGQIVTVFISQAIKMNAHDHHLFCLMQCGMNSILIDEVPKYQSPVPS